jgi:hypothetical protein
MFTWIGIIHLPTKTASTDTCRLGEEDQDSKCICKCSEETPKVGFNITNR